MHTLLLMLLIPVSIIMIFLLWYLSPKWVRLFSNKQPRAGLTGTQKIFIFFILPFLSILFFALLFIMVLIYGAYREDRAVEIEEDARTIASHIESMKNFNLFGDEWITVRNERFGYEFETPIEIW